MAVSHVAVSHVAASHVAVSYVAVSYLAVPMWRYLSRYRHIGTASERKSSCISPACAHTSGAQGGGTTIAGTIAVASSPSHLQPFEASNDPKIIIDQKSRSPQKAV